MTYNLTLMQSGTTFLSMFETVNTYSSDLFAGLFMCSIFLIMLFALKRYDFSSALLVSSWTSFILSGLLTYAGLLNFKYTLLFLGVAGFTALYVWTVGGREG